MNKIMWLFILFIQTKAYILPTICDKVNDHRINENVEPVLWSSNLGQIAEDHANNLISYHDSSNPEGCNVHSWYNKTDKTSQWWSNCCYRTSSDFNCMHIKGNEYSLFHNTSNLGTTFENAFTGYGFLFSIDNAIETWKSSPGHNALLLLSSAKSCGGSALQPYILLFMGTEIDSTEVTPTVTPTVNPTVTPTVNPTVTPTVNPTVTPTVNPTVTPTVNPTAIPTVNPTAIPTVNPTVTSVITPTMFQMVSPTVSPTMSPTVSPTVSPTTFQTITSTATPIAKSPSVSTTTIPRTKIYPDVEVSSAVRICIFC